MTSVIVQDPFYRAALEVRFPGVRFLDLAALHEEVVDDRVALLIGRPLPRDSGWMRIARRAEYVHFMSTGYDELSPEWLQGRTLTTAKGTNAVPVAEFAAASILARAKRLPEVWEPGYSVLTAPLDTLEGTKIAVLGYGTIGRTLVAMLRAFTDDVWVFRRSVPDTAESGVTFSDDVDTVLDGAGHVVLALSLTEDTHHILDAHRISALAPGAHVVNVGRAALVDQDALTRAAEEGRIVASLDVTTPEPLPEGHPLYTTAGVRISPHVAWSGPQVRENRIRLVAANLGAWLRGGELTNVALTPVDARR